MTATIDGTGSLTKLGTGMVILAGSNSYTGGTLVSAGTLQGTTDSLQGNITDNASLVFNQSVDGGYDGTIQGTGSLTKAGAGTVTFTGENNYSGGTTIGAGVLQLGDSGNQGSIVGAVVANGSGGFTVANADTTGDHVHHRQRYRGGPVPGHQQRRQRRHRHQRHTRPRPSPHSSTRAGSARA